MELQAQYSSTTSSAASYHSSHSGGGPPSPQILQCPDDQDISLLSIGRDKRSFRRPSGTPADHSLSAALLDSTPKRMASTRQKQGKKALIFLIISFERKYDSLISTKKKYFCPFLPS